MSSWDRNILRMVPGGRGVSGCSSETRTVRPRVVTSLSATRSETGPLFLDSPMEKAAVISGAAVSAVASSAKT